MRAEHSGGEKPNVRRKYLSPDAPHVDNPVALHQEIYTGTRPIPRHSARDDLFLA
jgi:hypothetical protein